MSNSQNRARVRARSTTPDGADDLLDALPGPILRFALATQPETALVGWSAAAHAGAGERRGTQSDHLPALVRRARRRAAVRRLLRLGRSRRAGLPGVPTRAAVREAVQDGLSIALPRPAVPEQQALAVARSRSMHPAGGRRGAGASHALDARGPAGRLAVELPQQRGREGALVSDD